MPSSAADVRIWAGPCSQGLLQSRCFDRGHGPVAAHGAQTKSTNDARAMITRPSNVLWRRGEILRRGDRVRCLLTWGCRSVGCAFEDECAGRDPCRREHVVGRYSASDGQRPILILAASCDRVNRCRNLCLLSCPRARRGKRSRGWRHIAWGAVRTTRCIKAPPVRDRCKRLRMFRFADRWFGKAARSLSCSIPHSGLRFLRIRSDRRVLVVVGRFAIGRNRGHTGNPHGPRRIC
jgi:hypothetical protein